MTNVSKIDESSYMENKGYKPLQINVLFDFYQSIHIKVQRICYPYLSIKQ